MGDKFKKNFHSLNCGIILFCLCFNLFLAKYFMSASISQYNIKRTPNSATQEQVKIPVASVISVLLQTNAMKNQLCTMTKRISLGPGF